MKVLVVDDVAYSRRAVRSVFLSAGYAVLTAEDGQEALDILNRDVPDLVITDILMPERDGMEVKLALTQEFLDARVIAMTGATGDHNLLNVAKLFGARRVIQKPFTPQEVRRVVRFTLDH